ncbi:hypothetical protein [Streptomyces sp. x-80]|uniref:hypothetical protein n=1 Tax=Streptomyces sp. x-80 TaxID=2789282 RepID=UPI0039813659
MLLVVLACERRLPQEQLRRDTGVDAGELHVLLTPLDERGHVVLGADDATITVAGERPIAALWTVQERVEGRL